MNFGANSAKVSQALRQQQPTYLVAPNFSITPASATTKGPLDLGTIVTDLRRYRPVNQGALNRVPIPEDERYVDVIEDVSSTVSSSRGGEGGIFAKILDQSIGGDASLKGQRSSEDVFTISKLETRYFYPSIGYVKQCLNLPDVRQFHEVFGEEEPIYLITGLKIAWGATVTTSRQSGYEGNLKAGVEAPAGVVDLGVGANTGLSRQDGYTSSYGKPRDFVLGIQLEKIRYKKKSLFSKGGLKAEGVILGAVLGNEEEDDLEDFEVQLEELDASEIAGMERVGGADAKESWLVPAEAS